MVKANAAPATNGNGTQSTYKSTNNRRKIQVRTLFCEGGKYTAVQINQLLGFNDARKIISDLRRAGMYIKDVRLDDRRKLYWLANDGQLNLFDQKGGSI